MGGPAFDFESLEERRQELGLSCELLARRSGVSRATVQRILSGKCSSVSHASVLSVVRALGLELRLDSQDSPRELKEEQARKRAKRLVALVQGTSGLEGQAVDRDAYQEMVDRTAAELLSGSKHRLWSDE
jgi:transcriptional regulator with XRE-family HTH domain